MWTDSQSTLPHRYRDKMVKRRNRVIEELISKDSTYKPPPGGG